MIDGRTLMYDAIMSNISVGKITPSRWQTFNGPCCVNRGQSRPDTKKRSGLMFDVDGRTSINCYNCNLKLSWSPGYAFSRRWEEYFKWLGMPSEKLIRLHFTVAELRKEMLNNGTMELSNLAPIGSIIPQFKEKTLPPHAMPLSQWIEEDCTDPDFLEAVEYLATRGDDILFGNNYYWTPDKTNGMNHRIIIPFWWEDQIVGYTGRVVNSSSNRRYMSDIQPHYIFNTENILDDWKYVFVTEGPFDGIAINGVSMLGDKITAEQAAWLNRTGKTVVVVPDRVNQGGNLVDVAIKEGWYVSFPSWDAGIKDAADAVQKYGKLYTVWSIIDTCTKNRLEISVKRQRLK